MELRCIYILLFRYNHFSVFLGLHIGKGVYIHIGVGSYVVCLTAIGNARASIRETDNGRFTLFLYICT